MKVLFAVSNEEISESIVKRYQKDYKEIISYKNVYYFNAILKEIQKDKTYDRIVISEDLEAFTHTQYDQIDKFIFDKLDSISDEAANMNGDDIPIILICSDRRTKSEQMLVKLFGIGIYNAILGNDRSVEEVCKLIRKPRVKKDAKAYYKIDVEDVKYQPENENDVSEVEIQNILAHYKRLGKNEEGYVESFDNIAAQYNDTQLRIISKFLPLNVRAVLEEKSPKYQKIMSFNNSVTNNLRLKKEMAEKDMGPSEKLLKPKSKENILSKPIVIPSAMQVTGGKKLSRAKPVQESVEVEETKKQDVPMQNKNVSTQKNLKVEKVVTEQKIDVEPQIEEVQEPKRRGRPRKNPVVKEEEKVVQPKRRGRPKKNVDIYKDLEETTVLPGFDEEDTTVLPRFEQEETTILPEFEQEEETTVLPGFEQEEETAVLPGFEQEEETTVLPGFEQEEETTVLPGFEQEDEESILPGFEQEDEASILPGFEKEEVTTVLSGGKQQEAPVLPALETEEVKQFDISNLLTADKKIACFVGTSKNGTSFIVNHMAEVLSSNGIDTAILDTTQNRNSYYIYTKNEEDLRNTAVYSIQNLVEGQAQGIKANKNLTIYTSLPDERNSIERTSEILQTLLQKHSLILIDCDFNTPVEYFAKAQEIYLVQSLDVLTIQPLTAFLRELKAKNVLEENKLRIVLNKVVKLRGITEKTIIGGMSSYNDPGMSFMVDLFDKNMVRYISIPFDEEVYTKYLESIINCDVSLKGYPKNFVRILDELGNMIYPLVSGKSTYRPPTISNSSGFTPTMNSTLEKMRRY